MASSSLTLLRAKQFHSVNPTFTVLSRNGFHVVGPGVAEAKGEGMHQGTVIDQLIESVERAEENVRLAKQREPKPVSRMVRVLDSVFELADGGRYFEVA